MNDQKLQLKIGGMACSFCAQSINKALRVTKVLERVDGVRSADVSLNDKLAKVSYDAEATDFEEMKQAVEKVGYTVERT